MADQTNPIADADEALLDTCRGPDGSNTCTLPRFHEGECVPGPVPDPQGAGGALGTVMRALVDLTDRRALQVLDAARARVVNLQPELLEAAGGGTPDEVVITPELLPDLSRGMVVRGPNGATRTLQARRVLGRRPGWVLEEDGHTVMEDRLGAGNWRLLSTQPATTVLWEGSSDDLRRRNEHGSFIPLTEPGTHVVVTRA